MCEPVSITMGAMAAVGALTSVLGQQQQANQEKDYNEQLQAANARQLQILTETANTSAVKQSEAENTRLAQEDARAVEETLQARVRGARASAEAQVDAQAAGVQGISMQGLYDDYARQTSRYTDAIGLAREQDQVTAGLRKEGFMREATNRIRGHDQFIPRPVSEPSALGSALKIAGAGAEGYFSYSKLNPRGKSK